MRSQSRSGRSSTARDASSCRERVDVARRHTLAFALAMLGGAMAAWSPEVSLAYELSTHAALTREACVTSRLGAADNAEALPTELILRLGLDGSRTSLGSIYLDLAHGSVHERQAVPGGFEAFVSSKFDGANESSAFKSRLPGLCAWIMLGAIREDDVKYDAAETENPPQDDPHGTFDRVRHHFYDPYRDWPLKALGVDLGVKAHDWAIRGPETSDGHENSFSIAMAREAMWRALTLKYAPGAAATDGTLPDLESQPTAWISSREALRLAYWATTFRALGDAVHMLQDMAQPQHTRNDFHGGLWCLPSACVTGHKSYYEAFVEAMVTRANLFRLRNRYMVGGIVSVAPEPVRLRDAVFSGYPVVRKSSYDEYFTTGIGGASTLGTGLANYANQGFYSAGTVVDTAAAAVYGSPPATRAGLAESPIDAAQVVDAANLPVGAGRLVLLEGQVRDSLNPSHSRASVPLAAEGAFDQFLNPTVKRHTTLNHYNYAAQAEMLLPRAVAYSAGLIDYFFHGALEIGLPDEGVFAAADAGAGLCKDTCGFERVKLRLTNATPGEDLGPGVAVAVVRFHRNTCYRSDLSGEPGGPNFASGGCRHPEEEIVVSKAKAIAALPAGGTQALTFDFGMQKIPINATDVKMQVAFRGRLGGEADAVAVTTRNVAEPTFLALENATDYRFSTSTQTYAPSGAPEPFTAATVTFGDAAVPLAGGATIPAPGFAQIAFLGDRVGTPVRIDFKATNLSGGHPLTATLPAFEFYLPAGSGTTYASNWPVGRVRGMYRRFVYSVARTQGYEVYQCAPDFNPAACREDTLPPLTAAHAVAWAVALQ